MSGSATNGGGHMPPSVQANASMKESILKDHRSSTPHPGTPTTQKSPPTNIHLHREDGGRTRDAEGGAGIAAVLIPSRLDLTARPGGARSLKSFGTGPPL